MPSSRQPTLTALIVTLLALVFGSCAASQTQAPRTEPGARPPVSKEDIAPEAGSGIREVQLARARRFMVAAAHEDATRAGVEVLKSGGTAMDAAVAVQMMLTLVEPQSSGIGGGAFLLYWDASQGRLFAWDGRETAPADVSPHMFLDESGAPLEFLEAVVGGRSVGVPGVVRMLEDAHGVHGKLPWATLFEPAIEKATAGFVIYDRLHVQIAANQQLRDLSPAREYFYDAEGSALPVGTVRKNLPLARTLRTIASGGADAFYEGPLAREIVDAVQRAPVAPGALSLDDLKSYRAVQRDPVCIDYRQRRVCGAPPPTSGGITTLQMLGMLRAFDMGKLEPRGVEAAHLLAEAGRYAFADRARYIADPAFVDVPTAALLDAEYLQRRAAAIDPTRAASEAQAGELPAPKGASRLVPAPSLERVSTSHFVIFDAYGNVASMTTSIENVFGSRVMVEGFLLNNQLTDFSFQPIEDGREVANAVAPKKRPRSSMAPIVVFDADGAPFLAMGSPGGSRIIPYVTQALVAVLDWGLDVQEAVALPHVSNRNGVTEIEGALRSAEELASLQRALEARGHDVKVAEMTSGLHAIERRDDGVLEGATDPRREGLALGE